MSISENIQEFTKVMPDNVTLVAVSKTKPLSDLQEAYDAGQRVFGENKVQEMEAKWQELPKDIEWHMIGHVQRNKVKYMAPFVNLIHAVDSPRLLKEINKEAKKNNRVIQCLLQLKIAEEDSKFGMSEADAKALLTSEAFKSFENISVVGLMGMATFTDRQEQVRNEFKKLKRMYDDFSKTQQDFTILSMGMSGDYQIALEEGSTMVRVGSSIFGERNY
ncbi:YggS family pyridoxal phosphate-dependent enzyme [Rasiella sp. SM2506]|uniref:YggS family pyridoxal phosphate-dependent enzyme n=1 Tax=Rasiella sp. SM2506 TaxID=3423914 RepID=UPI003D7925BE